MTDKVVRIKVNKPYDQSTLARILTLVQDAAERKAPAELFILRFARIYTPIVTVPVSYTHLDVYKRQTFHSLQMCR